MEIIRYDIKKGDTLESIANDHDLSVKELINFHNDNCGLTSMIIGKEIPIQLNFLLLEKNREKRIVNINDEYEDTARYRCEQTVITKLNGIPTNTADTKREYIVKKRKINNIPVVEVSITDQIVVMNPNQYQDAVLLVADLDRIKCNGVILEINIQSGNIEKIINHDDIIKHWQKHKHKLEEGYSFVRNPKAAEAIRSFINMAEKQIINQETLIEDLKTKMFFDAFFDKHLVNAEDKLEPYKRKFYSQLFLGEIIDLHIKQDLLRETESKILIRKVSSIGKEIQHSDRIQKQYEEKYKPVIHYRFSEYNISYRERVVYDEEQEWLEHADITVIEEVKNNVQLLVNYKLQKIE
ncbi:LysM peptidoglycan-binding domain-containing protein [Chryseobacterium arthrosphaerae]|uniref:LysM domain-containing protein n=1 Tax=Chryseobacterium arthrosphaerae TaxID=651561 RepID=A0A1B8ZF87_9FLAO|nr:LysM peptidoglycan-binding domain-containing protein [Chryseobacterium arthrosphaerae]OCA70271.1 hypothetical protein BBI00_20810 [Chryseobacterium arthrosphaerae]